MPQYLLSYEVTPPAADDAFLNLAPKHGWSLRVESSKKVKYRLPAGAVVGAFGTIGEAEKAFQALSVAAGKAVAGKVELRKYILVEYVQSKFDSDERSRATPANPASSKLSGGR